MSKISQSPYASYNIQTWYNVIETIIKTVKKGANQLDPYLVGQAELLSKLFEDCKYLWEVHSDGEVEAELTRTIDEIHRKSIHIFEQDDNLLYRLCCTIACIIAALELLNDYSKNEIIRGITDKVYNDSDVPRLLGVSRNVGRLVIDSRLPTSFSIIKEHIKEQLEYLSSYSLLKQNNPKRLNTQISNESQNVYPPCLFNLENNKLQYIYGELTRDSRFLPNDTNRRHFDFVFGGGVCPADFTPLRWNVSKQALSELIILITGGKAVPRPINKAIGKVFMDAKNNPIKKLSNPKEGEYSNDYSALETITNALKTRSP